MAIDPKLVSIKEAKDLPTSEAKSTSDFLFFEDQVLKKSPMSSIYDKVTSGIKGVATQANAPTTYTAEAYPNGLFETYVVRTPLTMPNSWGSAVTQAELDANNVYFDVKNGVITKSPSLKPTVPLVATTGTSMTSAMHQKAVTDQVQILNEKIETLTEKDEELIIDVVGFTKDSRVTENPTAEITVTNTAGSVLTGDFTAWGTSVAFPAVVEYSDGTYESIFIREFTTTTAIAELPFAKTVVKIGNMHDSNLGQHLSDMGYKALGNYLYNYPKRIAFRQDLVNGIDFQDHTKLDNTILNANSQVVLSFSLVGGYSPYWVDIGVLSQEYFQIGNKKLGFYNTDVAGAGIGYDYDAPYNGFIEVWAGTDLAKGEGSGKIRLLNKSDLSLVEEKTFKGAVKKIVISHPSGSYVVQIVTAEAVMVEMNISQINHWRKREISGGIFNASDRILFMADSWGVYPGTADTGLKAVRYDGTLSEGKAFMPAKFKELFIAGGGSASNILLAIKSGMTTEWARYWLGKFISETTPNIVVFNFGINDYNSFLIATADSAYDFDPVVPWTAKTASTGGISGKVTEARFVENLKYLKDYCISKGVTPIFLSTPKTGSFTQAQGLAIVAKKYFLKGIN